MITISTLSNGMRVLTDFLPQRETVNLGLWIKAGSRHESQNQNGISHLLEHMTFRGTPSYTPASFSRTIEAVGGHLNAYTSREATSYYARVLKQDVRLAVHMIAEMVQDPLLPTDELEREKNVILQEIAQSHDTPDEVLFDRFQATAFPHQALGRPITGTLDSVKTFDREDLLGHLKKQYQPAHMIFIASGPIDHQTLVTNLEHTFTKSEQDGRLHFEKADYEGGFVRLQKSLEQVHLTLGFEGVSLTHDLYHAQSLLAMILGVGMSSRLFQEAREKRGLVYSIQAFTSGFTDSGLFGIYAGTREETLSDLLVLIRNQLLSLPETLTPEEISRGKNQLKSSLMTALETPSTRIEQIAHHLLVYGRPLDPYEILDRIDALGPEHLIKVAEKILASQPTLCTLGPLKAFYPLVFQEPLALSA